MKRNKKVCNKCNKEITNSNFNRHYEKCNGITTRRLIELNTNWLQDNGKYKCPYCKNEFSKMGICSHINIKHLNGKLNANLVSYIKKVSEGKLPRNKNQYELAKERGEKYSLSIESRKK